MKLIQFFTTVLVGSFALALSSCMEQKVTDSRGNVVYDKPVIGTPWQSTETTKKQVQANEEAMGIR